jgi:hypothetical protein
MFLFPARGCSRIPLTRMPFDHSRTCLLTLRLTDREYELVKTVSVQQGSRSVAEFLRRAALYQVTRAGEGNVSFADDLATLTVRLQELEESLKDTSSRISRLLGTERNSQEDGIRKRKAHS